MPWKQIAAGSGIAPSPRGGHAVAVLGNTLLLFGGADRSPRAYDDLWQLEVGKGDQAEWTRISSSFPPSVACTARSGAALVTVAGKVYLFGGQEPNTGVCFNDILELDPQTWAWSRIQVQGTRPPARHSCIAVGFKDQCILVFGGAGLQGALCDVWLFNCLDGSWSCPRTQGQRPAAREMAAGVMVAPDQLIIYGGRSSDGKILDDIVQLILGDTWAWGSSFSTQLPRCAHSLVAVPAPQQHKQQGLPELVGQQEQQLHQLQQQQLLVFGGFSGAAVEGSCIALQQQQQQQEASQEPHQTPWTIQQLHAGTDVQSAAAAGKARSGKAAGDSSNSSSSGGDGSSSYCPAPRFAHAAAALSSPKEPGNQVMVVVGGVNPAEDLMDVAVWEC